MVRKSIGLGLGALLAAVGGFFVAWGGGDDGPPALEVGRRYVIDVPAGGRHTVTDRGDRLEPAGGQLLDRRVCGQQGGIVGA